MAGRIRVTTVCDHRWHIVIEGARYGVCPLRSGEFYTRASLDRCPSALDPMPYGMASTWRPPVANLTDDIEHALALFGQEPSRANASDTAALIRDLVLAVVETREEFTR